MAESGHHSRSALMDAADRLELVVRGVRSRQLSETGQAQGSVPSSTLYVRSDEEALDRPLMSNPAQTWSEMTSLGNGAISPGRDIMPKARSRGWRYYMPWPVRWVMGWP